VLNDVVKKRSKTVSRDRDSGSSRRRFAQRRRTFEIV